MWDVTSFSGREDGSTVAIVIAPENERTRRRLVVLLDNCAYRCRGWWVSGPSRDVLIGTASSGVGVCNTAAFYLFTS